MSYDNMAIKINNISKCYQIYGTPTLRLKQFILPRLDRYLGNAPRTFHEDFWALKSISFEIPRGQTLGIVGRNGSGKSTLLQIIAGTLSPTQGEVQVNGRVAALLELGAGFNNDFTGRENVYLNASLLGLTREQTDARMDDILSFADIGRFADSPVRSYSSGMLVRLAFAVQAQIDPDILIVDEALAVGDAKFQAKCFARLSKLKQEGTSILLVSHATEQIVTHCDRALLLDGGEMKDIGAPRDIVNRYLDILFGKEKNENSEHEQADNNAGASLIKHAERIDYEINFDANLAIPNGYLSKIDWLKGAYAERPNYNSFEYRWGDRAAEFVDFHMKNSRESYPSILMSHEVIEFAFLIRFHSMIIRPIFGFAVKTKEGITIYNTNSELQGLESVKVADTNTELIVSVRLPVSLYEGDYFISVGIASSSITGEINPHDRRYDSIHFTVGAVKNFTGLADLDARIQIEHN